MNDQNTEYQTIISKIDLLYEKLELYTQTNQQRLDLIRSENKAYQDSIRAEIKAYQDANKQQLSISLGVLVTAAVAMVSVVLSR